MAWWPFKNNVSSTFELAKIANCIASVQPEESVIEMLEVNPPRHFDLQLCLSDGS